MYLYDILGNKIYMSSNNLIYFDRNMRHCITFYVFVPLRHKGNVSL